MSRRRFTPPWVGAAVTLTLVAIVAFGLVRGGGTGDDRVHSITQRLRCPVCQAESVADSPSTTARAMARVVEQQVRAGRTDQQILGFFRQRYGRWILLDPPRSGDTLLLWLLPPAALAAGLVVLLRSRSRRTAARTAEAPTERPVRRRELARISVPWEGPGRRTIGVALVAGALVLAGVLAVRGTAPRAAGGTVTGGPTSAGADLANVTTAELATAVDQNPEIVPMRLALIQRYLRDGDPAAAHAQARTALAQATTTVDRQRALKLGGWTTALVGQPEAAAAMLQASLLLDPTDRDAKWFLANVRLVGLRDAAGATVLLQDLLRSPMGAARRQEVKARLAEAEAHP